MPVTGLEGNRNSLFCSKFEEERNAWNEIRESDKLVLGKTNQ